MRKKPLFLVAFLLMLYIAPMIFISSYGSVAIPAEQDMSKDFSLSGYGDESPQSINSCSETLPDDVLFFPDLSINSTKVFASAGEGLPSESGFLSNTYVDNNDNLGGYDTTSPTVANVTLDFDDIQSEAEGIYYYLNLYVHPDNDDADFWIWNYNSSVWELLIANVPTGPAYYSDSIFSTDYISSGNVSFLFNGTTTGATVGCYIQYAYLNSHIMTLADSGFAAGFTGVDDWTTSSSSISSDGDLATIACSATGRAYASFSSRDYFGYYYEFQISNVTDVGSCNFEFWDGSAYHTLTTVDTVGIYKGIIADSDAETMQRIGWQVSSTGGGSDGIIKPDYLRISPSDEMGWQHDGSTTSEVTDDSSADWTYTKSSDGDILTFAFNRTATGAADSFGEIRIPFDTTATAHDVELSYYPFFKMKWRVTAVSGGQAIIYYYTDGKTAVSASETITGGYITTTTDWRTDKFNAFAMTGSSSNKYISFFCKGTSLYHSMTVEMDYFKAYSIANFTVTQSGATTDDYLYVDSGILYSHVDDGYIEVNHDPALDIGPHYEWNMNTSLGTPEVDFYDGVWLGYSSEIEGEFSIGSTVTDFRLKFTDNANIMSLKFTDLVGWYDAGTVIIFFEVPVFTGSLDALLIFFGLILIPASTLYFVKGGKDEMSSDKLFYCLIAFVIGWGLFLGGIYG